MEIVVQVNGSAGEIESGGGNSAGRGVEAGEDGGGSGGALAGKRVVKVIYVEDKFLNIVVG